MKMNLDSDGGLTITTVIRPDFFDPSIPNEEDIMAVAGVAVQLGYPSKWRYRGGNPMGEVSYVFYKD